MANWYGTSRSNYFKVKDPEAFEAAMDLASANYWRNPEGLYAISGGDEGYWPSELTVENDEDDISDIWFPEYVAPFLADGEVAIFMSAGAEKLRYITGNAVAINNTKEYVQLDLEDIYAMAKAKFNVEPTLATY